MGQEAVDGDADGAEIDELLGFNKVDRERMIRIARQEIQGAWECFGRAEIVAPALGVRELDEGSTRVREAFKNSELECTFCGKVDDHRCGECMLPRNLGGRIQEDTISVDGADQNGSLEFGILV